MTAMILVLAAVIVVIIIFIICLILILFKHIKKTQNGRRQQGEFKTIVTEWTYFNITYTENISNEMGPQDIELEVNEEVSSLLS